MKFSKHICFKFVLSNMKSKQSCINIDNKKPGESVELTDL